MPGHPHYKFPRKQKAKELFASLAIDLVVKNDFSETKEFSFIHPKLLTHSVDFRQARSDPLAPLLVAVEVTPSSSPVPSAISPQSLVDKDVDVVMDDAEPAHLEDISPRPDLRVSCQAIELLHHAQQQASPVKTSLRKLGLTDGFSLRIHGEIPGFTSDCH